MPPEPIAQPGPDLDVTPGPDAKPPMGLAKKAAIVLSAWLPFAVLWMLFVRIFLDSTITYAAFSASVAIGIAAVLGVGVWRVSGLMPWPRRLSATFYLSHIALGLVYSLTWNLSFMTVLVRDGGWLAPLLESGDFGWRVLMGLWLYGLVAGVSYALRIGRRVVEQERLIARAQALAVEARLESLRSQLHPHFLFNALHTIRTLVNTDPELAQGGIERLGRLLRYTLERSPGESVPLSEEWSFAEDYLELERVRLGERLEARCTLSEDARDRPVPPFVVQPLVENAVIHGISPSMAGGTVQVQAHVVDGNLRIRVADDGVGADPATMSEGHGHRLLRERLEGLYGGRASVEFAGAPQQGLGVTLSIPLTLE